MGAGDENESRNGRGNGGFLVLSLVAGTAPQAAEYPFIKTKATRKELKIPTDRTLPENLTTVSAALRYQAAAAASCGSISPPVVRRGPDTTLSMPG